MRYSFVLAIVVSIVLVGCAAPSNEPATNTSVPDDHNLSLSDTSNLPFPAGNHSVEPRRVDYGVGQGYLASPTNDSDAPGIILVHEWWGLNEHIQATADKLASHGYQVLAVDMYNGSTAESASRAAELSGSVTENDSLRHLRSARTYFDEQGVGAVGTLGFCFGGDQTMRFATDEQNLDASAVFYGEPITNETRVRRIDHPFLGVFGENDSVVSVDRARDLDEALDNVTDHQLFYYEGASHAFANPSGESFNQEAARDAWTRTLQFFEDTLR